MDPEYTKKILIRFFFRYIFRVDILEHTSLLTAKIPKWCIFSQAVVYLVNVCQLLYEDMVALLASK